MNVLHTQFTKHSISTMLLDDDNNPTIVATENPARSKGYATNFTVVEDLIVTMAYCRALEDSISHAKQKGHIFKSTVEAVCKSILLEQEDKESCDASCPSYLCEVEGTEPVPHPHHTRHSIHTRFTKNISPAICMFISIKNANELDSGEDLVTYKMRLLTIYKDRHGADFKFYPCFNFLKDHLKFMSLLQADNNQAVIINGRRKAGIRSSSKCPNGMKKAKKEKQ